MFHTDASPLEKSDSTANSTISTGSMQSHQPPGGGSDASTGAGTRRTAGGYLLPQPSSSRTQSTVTSGIPAPMWLSTSARPMGTGPNLMSPGLPRVASPPQPPPLPPPPPSPQLVPLKARLARSKSIASPTVSSPTGTEQLTAAAGRRQDPLSVLARRAAFGHGPSKSLRETSSPPDPDHRKTLQKSSPVPITAASTTVPTSESVEKVPFSTSSAFPPIAHPRERNPVAVCLASLAFLVVSAVVAVVFSTLLLPLCLLAVLIRRVGLCWANCCLYPPTAPCCRCHRPQRRLMSSTNPLHLFLSRLYPAPNMDDPEASVAWCQCEPVISSVRSGTTYRALSPAELRWLPPVHSTPVPSHPTKTLTSDLSQLETRIPTYYSDNPPLIVICLRFGAPGVRLAKLREVIATRLLPRHSTPSSLTSSPHGSCFSDKWTIGTPGTIASNNELRQRANSLVPPEDTLARLTQCLTCLSTGYAWQPCNAFRLEEHVLPVPITCLPELSDKLARARHTTADSLLDSGVQDGIGPVPVRAESVVSAVSRLPFLLHRPLWQVYLLEQYQELDSTEPSDAESAAESDDLESSHRDNSWTTSSFRNGGDRRVHSPVKKRSRVGGPMADLKVPSSSGFVCRRSGSTGVGSLLVFRLHAALSDDGKALVHLLTSCLADLPSRTSSPLCTPIRPTSNVDLGGSNPNAAEEERTQKRRWRGQINADNPAEVQSEFDKSHGTASAGKNQSTTSVSDELKTASRKPTVPARSYATTKPTVITTPSSDGGSTAGDKTGNVRSAPARPSVRVRSPNSTGDGSSSPLLRPTTAVRNGSAESRNSGSNHPVIFPDDEDPEESEAAQWWYTFWSSSLATIATFCDLIRALLTGPAIILHKYFFTRADMGILTKPQSQPHSSTESRQVGPTRVYKCALLSLVKLSRVRQVTKASYAEIILSLLAGGLRAYHQTVGLKHPPDLLSFLSVEVPVLPLCTLNSLQRGATGQQLGLQRCDGSPCPGIARLMPSSQRVRTAQNESNSSMHCPQSDSLVETGLIGNEHRMVAIGAPPATTNSLRPGRHVLADICLPINTEGMLPRLWETRQRLIELNNSVDPLCLAWARTVLYTLMPHPMAEWLEANFGGSAKASVSFTGVEVVSPFSGHSQPKEQDPSITYQMPPTRRLAYMSLLASKSAEARTLRRRLRRRLPRGALVCPPRLGTSFRALARHLTNANAGLVYIAGSPVIRIDTWMPSPRLAGDLTPINGRQGSPAGPDGTSWMLCRDLSVAFTTYAGQLSLTFCANSAMDNHPNLDLILQAMRMQLRKMCRLLAGRHVPSPTDRWLYRSTSMETGTPSPSNALSLSPSLNPSLVLRQDSSPTAGADKTTQSTLSGDSFESHSKSGIHRGSPTTGVVHSTAHEKTSSSSKHSKRAQPNLNEVWSCTGRAIADSSAGASSKTVSSTLALTHLTNQISVQTYACQSGQPTEQLQDRLQWVQQQLNDAASSTPSSSTRKRLTHQELADLRNEFCTLLRELKQRCSLGSLGISPEVAQSASDLGPESPGSETTGREGCLAVVHARTGGYGPNRPGQMKFGLGETIKTRGDKQPSECSSTASAGSKPIGTKSSAGLEYGADVKHAVIAPTGGDFDEDPDFYIDAYGDDDDEEFEEEDLEEVTEPPFTVVGSGVYGRPPVPVVAPERVGTKNPPRLDKRMKGTEISVIDTRDISTSNVEPYHTKSKWRRTSVASTSGNRKRRRSSLLSADVTSFDLIPNRRGSLGGSSTCSAHPYSDGLLSKLVKRKLGGLITSATNPGTSGSSNRADKGSRTMGGSRQ